MRYFCTYFDSNYLGRGLALYRSLQRHAAPFRLWVLCFDDQAYDTLQRLALPGLEPIALADFEKGDDALLTAKATRGRFEYYFTCTPSLPLYVFAHCPEADVVTYLDADLYFFAGPAPVEAEFGDGSILIIGHRYPPGQTRWDDHGIYNVGYLSFRRDETGLACLRWWRERCLEWCFDWVEPGRFADQKYLDRWPEQFPGVVVLAHKGANLAPWNVGQYRLAWQDGCVLIDGETLIFYHFHGLSPFAGWLYDPRLRAYGVKAGAVLRRGVYAPYVRELWSVRRWLALQGGRLPAAAGADRRRAADPGLGGLEARLRRAFWHFRRLLAGEIWAAPCGRLLW